MKIALCILVGLYTAAMWAVHIGSGALIRRAWAGRPLLGVLTLRPLLSFEAGYYVLLLPYALAADGPIPRIPLLLFSTLHIGAWVATRLRPQLLATPQGAPAQRRELIKLVAFDLAESLFLFYVGWRLVSHCPA